ncbi:MAG: hypothetical protein C4348_02300, partial [Patescibacteria group bacterium]
FNTSGFSRTSGWTNGKIGWALAFDRVDDYVQVPYMNVFNQRPFTVMGWVWLNQTSGNRPLFSTGDVASTDRYLHLLARNSFPYLGFYFDDLQSPTSLNLNRWYHLTFVWEGPVTKKQIIYINGIKDSERISTGLLTVTSGSATGDGGWIGRYSGSYQNGLIDEVRIYNRALSDQEIKALYEVAK